MELYLKPKINEIKNKEDLNNFIPYFLYEMDIAASSRETYQMVLDKFFKYLENKRIAHPGRADIIEYKQELSKNHTAKTVNLNLSVIRNFFSWTNFYHIYPDIAYGIKSQRAVKKPGHQALTSSQIGDILNNIDCSTLCGLQKYALVLLSATTGLRAAEISSLNVEDLVNIQDRTVLMVKGKGYNDKGQMVVIGKHTDEAIRSVLSVRQSLSTADPLFISTSNFSYGKRISPKGIGKILKNILQENNFTGSFYTGHSFRHSACCLALEVTDQDLIGVKKFMRHQNLETTMIYADHGEFLKNNIAEEIEKKLL